MTSTRKYSYRSIKQKRKTKSTKSTKNKKQKKYSLRIKKKSNKKTKKQVRFGGVYGSKFFNKLRGRTGSADLTTKEDLSENKYVLNRPYITNEVKIKPKSIIKMTSTYPTEYKKVDWTPEEMDAYIEEFDPTPTTSYSNHEDEDEEEEEDKKYTPSEWTQEEMDQYISDFN
jgi:hypothetical protein